MVMGMGERLEKVGRFFRAVRYVYRHGEGALFRDPLTGLYNRRFLEELWPGKVEHARRAAEPLALVMTDLDHFKRLNDTLGHRAGDLLLCRAAEVIRRTDIAVRWGGDEFLILLVDTDQKGAERVVERLRAWLAEEHISLSAGIACWVPAAASRESPPALEDLVGEADRALYADKRLRRELGLA
jgi:diguanylate cyclase (GGDEF)-like protein